MKKINDATDSNAICDVRPKTISLKKWRGEKDFWYKERGNVDEDWREARRGRVCAVARTEVVKQQCLPVSNWNGLSERLCE